MSSRIKAIVSACLLAAGLSAAEPQVLANWTFGDEGSKRWMTQVNHCSNVRVDNGVLKGVMSGSDPFLTSPAFSLVARPGQVVEFRAKCVSGGAGELFWIPVGEKGPQQKWSVSFDWIGDGAWHDYRVQPFWQGEKAIGAMRLDFVNGQSANGAFEISSVRIVDETGASHAGEPVWSDAALAEWSATEGGVARVKDQVLTFRTSATGAGLVQSPMLKADADAACVLAVDMAVSEGDSGTVMWATDAVSGLQRRKFRVKPDGKFHTYNIDLASEKNWTGNVVLLRLVPSVGKGQTARIRSVRLCDDLQGPADVSVTQARLAEAINRVGAPSPLLVQFSNCGGTDAKQVALSVKKLPKGVRVTSAAGWERVPEIPASGLVTHTLVLVADRAVSGVAEFKLSGDGTDGQGVKAPIEFLPDLKQPKAAYVPQPRPLKSDYEIGALYFPGWSKIEAWSHIWPVAPERKPVLGWYDEANPEVVDWQIKWAVENGLSYLLVDWYWNKGDQHHDHWVKAFQQAHYKSYLKWAVMWANHNPEGSHSEADQREVTRFWIEHYFNTQEYYRIDGKPVVMIWSPQNMNRDVGADGCKRLLEISRQMAREAGYKGIYFIAMKWPEVSYDAKVVQGLKDMGFDMTSIYHYMGHAGKAENPRRYSFTHVADSNCALWQGLFETGILPFLPNLSTGWDDRPWHGDKGTEVYGRTVEDFRRICKDAKRFADKTGVKRLTLAPLNEWGEGSYAEPCAEFGFGMYEAVRETFCQKPQDGWPLNFGPKDVGLGPYDLPVPPPDSSTDWAFSSGTQGWFAAMGIADFKAGEAGLTFATKSYDPAMERSFPMIRTKMFRQIVVRMKLSVPASGACQLFWSSGGTPTEGTSLTLPVIADGQLHDYVFDVGACRTWRGRFSRLRFDPCNTAGVQVAIERIRLVPAHE